MSEATNIAVAPSPDGKTILFDLLGLLWIMPIEGGAARCLSDAFADLAYQCMQWRLPSEGAFRGLGAIDRHEHGLPTEEEYVERYCERTGVTAIPNWSYYLAFSFFRLAAILQGVYKRSLDGNASNPERARRMGEAVPMLAAMAMALIEGGDRR